MQQIEESTAGSSQAGQSSSASTTTTPAVASQVKMVRLVTPPGVPTTEVFDLTEEDEDWQQGDIPITYFTRVIGVVGDADEFAEAESGLRGEEEDEEFFDCRELEVEIPEGVAVIAMDLQDEEEDVVEVNATHTERGEPDAVPITLDSGADISVLPREFADRGVWSQGTTSLKMIDAQGREIKHDGVTKARVQVWSKDGKLIEIVEDFVLGNVKHPILCAGRMMKRGWDIKREEGEPCLVHDMGTSVPLRMERNSLLFDAKIFTVEAELNEKPLEVNVLRGYLSKYLKDLEMSPGWHRLPNGVVVFSDPVVSILLGPRQSIESDMRGRLTMFKEKDGIWRQVENVEDYLQLGNMAF